jgi:CMP-N,N'-diacetyllegionaminic acid synthase
MRILALIAARGGSKRVPGKNIRPLGGSPLIVWSINIAKSIPEICDILISTDSNEIAGVAKNAGALVPWLRPKELATDTASSVDVCLHALKWYEDENGKVDGLVLLQPTSPFRSRDSVLRGIELFRLHQHCPVIGVSAAESHPMWCFKIEEGTMRPFIEGEGLHLRSQDLPPAYVINGAFYLIAPKNLRKLKSFYSENMVPLVIDEPEENLDIDTEWDWNLAEAILKSHALFPRTD